MLEITIPVERMMGKELFKPPKKRYVNEGCLFVYLSLASALRRASP